MSYVTELRNNLQDQESGRANARAAGSGVWANYVRSTCYPQQPATVEELNAKHAEVVKELESIAKLTNKEKNSITSAKSVIKGATLAGVGVWQRNDDGTIKSDEAGQPMPKGKSDLQDKKDPLEVFIKTLARLEEMAGDEEFPIVDHVTRTTAMVHIRNIMKCIGGM